MFVLGLIVGVVVGGVVGTFVGPNVRMFIHYLKNGAGR